MKVKSTLVALIALVSLILTPLSANATSTPITVDVSINQNFNANGSGYDLSSHIQSIRQIQKGTVNVTFTTTQSSGVMTLLSASDSQVDSRNATLAVVQGHLYWEVRNNSGAETRYLAKLDAEDAFVADGTQHTASVQVTSTNTSIFLDGQQVYSTTSTAFFNSLTNITDLRAGANVDVNGTQWQFNGEIFRVYISNDVDGPANMQDIVAAPTPKQVVDNSQASLNPAASATVGTRNFTLLVNVPATAGLTQQLLVLKRAGTAVLIAEYNSDDFVVRMGGSSLRFDGSWSGKARRIALSIKGDRVTVYSDGTYVGAGNLQSTSLPTVDGIEATGASAYVYAGSLTPATIERISSYSRPVEYALFDTGFENSVAYRIPSLLTTTHGTLIAGADQRVPSASDSPNDINFVIRRSFDNGRTWEDMQSIVNLPGTGNTAASTIDSVLLQNPSTGVITAVIDLFPGGIGQPNNRAGVGMDAQGRLELFDCNGAKFLLEASGAVVTEGGQLTNFYADETGDIFNSGVKVGNYYEPARGSACNQSGLHILDTAYLIVTQSSDDGATWSRPRFINNQVKLPWMKFIGTGPGTGIVIDSGSHAGRIVVPIYYSNLNNVYSSAVIYSDDDGLTWHRGQSPNDVRSFSGTVPTSQYLTQSSQSLHEASVVQSGVDELTLFMRNLNPGKIVGISRSTDGGQTWSVPTFDSGIPDIFSQPNAISYGPNHQTIVFANATARLSYRGRGVIRISHDGGRTWTAARTFNPGHYVYQAMSLLPDGRIAILWEREWQGLYFTIIDQSWIESSPVNTIR